MSSSRHRPAGVAVFALTMILSSPNPSRADTAFPNPDLPLPVDALAALEPEWRAVLENPNHEVAVRYTHIDRDPASRPEFHSFARGTTSYFYPASTVKLPAVLLALEALGEDPLHDEGVTVDSPLRTADGTISSLRAEIRAILLVSDNDAFNVLFDLVGPDTLSTGMTARGYAGTRIFHRLSGIRSGRDRPAGPLEFLTPDGHWLAVLPPSLDCDAYRAPAPIPRGQAHLTDGRRVDEPMDFADHNAYPLAAQQEALKALVFPESVPESARFRLTADHRALVLHAMSQLPAESDNPTLDPATFPGAYARFFGAGPGGMPLPGVRTFGKSGQAYGTTTDNAYIVDHDAGVEFLLAATIYTNANGTLNDDTYEYHTLAEPFLHALCRALLAHEYQRPRPHPSDFRETRAFLRHNAIPGEKNEIPPK